MHNRDLDSAVAAGIISADQAAALRAHALGAAPAVAADGTAPEGGGIGVDEENFRLLTGFNDIFVAIAAVLLLVALAWIGAQTSGRGAPVPSPLAGFLPAAAAWGLAEYFTKRRRMALPSIILLIAFVLGVLVGTGFTVASIHEATNRNDPSGALGSAYAAIAAAVTAGAAYLHWRRFRVPITVAVGSVVAVGGVIALVLIPVAPTGGAERLFLPLLFVGGVALFALAMWWDGSDRERLTRRSDVAFWLHLAAAPAIAHAVFNGLGVTNGDLSVGTALGVLALYIAFALLALAIDRRALLVSGLAYVLYAMSRLFEEFGAVGLNIALTGLVIGSALLLLSAFWHPIRRAVVHALPASLQHRLPVLERAALSPRPA